MILGRLFTKLFELGTVVVATSNVAPDDLYKGGLNRALFLPFIAQIEEQMDVLRLDARTDFRLEKLAGVKMWLVPADDAADAALDKAWAQADRQRARQAARHLDQGPHPARAACSAQGVARFHLRRSVREAAGGVRLPAARARLSHHHDRPRAGDGLRRSATPPSASSR